MGGSTLLHCMSHREGLCEYVTLLIKESSDGVQWKSSFREDRGEGSISIFSKNLQIYNGAGPKGHVLNTHRHS